MAKNNAVAENNTVNNTNEKEVREMANNNVQQENAPVQEQQATPVAAPVTDQQVPAETPAAVPQTFAEKHPKLAAAGEKAKKIGKWVGLGAAVVGGLFVAHKLGEASGFDKATDAYNSRQSGDDPEPDENPDDDLGEADFDEVDSTES